MRKTLVYVLGALHYNIYIYDRGTFAVLVLPVLVPGTVYRYIVQVYTRSIYQYE